MKKLTLTAFAAVALALAGCKTTATKQAGLYYGGYRAAAEVIDRHAGNRESIETIADTIDIVLEQDEILFSALEEWYGKEKAKLGLDPIDQEFLDTLIVRPLWERIKSKYEGISLSLDNPDVQADILAFQAGLRRALSDF